MILWFSYEILDGKWVFIVAMKINKRGNLSKNVRFNFIHKKRLTRIEVCTWYQTHTNLIMKWRSKKRRMEGMEKKEKLTIWWKGTEHRLLFFTHVNFSTHAKSLWKHPTNAKTSTHAMISIHTKILWTHATHVIAPPTPSCVTHATHVITPPTSSFNPRYSADSFKSRLFKVYWPFASHMINKLFLISNLNLSESATKI